MKVKRLNSNVMICVGSIRLGRLEFAAVSIGIKKVAIGDLFILAESVGFARIILKLALEGASFSINGGAISEISQTISAKNEKYIP